MRKWEKKLLDGIRSVSSEKVNCVFKFDKENKVLDVVLDETCRYRYQICPYRSKWSVCEMRSDNGFGFRIISDWDGFRRLDDAIEAIIEDVRTKIALHEDEIAEEQRIFSETTSESEAVIEDETGQEILIEYVLQKVVYIKRDIWHIGVIVNAQYHDHIHDDEENEMIRKKYVGKEIRVDTDGNWEIK